MEPPSAFPARETVLTAGPTPYPHLFSPIKLGPCELRHRAVIPGHSMMMSSFEPGVSDRLHAYMLRRAQGGAALVGIESAPVHESSVNFSAANVFSDDAVPSLRRLADAVHKAGSKLSIILWHGGHNISHRYGAGHAVAPSMIPGPRSRETPKVLTRREIAELVKAYGAAARRCREAGLDVLEVQTATDYLLGQFMSPRLNWRSDEYGGSLENRMRIVCAVLEAVREAAGQDIAVGVRTSVAHHIPGDPHDYDIADSLPCMTYLDQRGLLDYVSLITGSHWSFPQTIPPMTMPRAGLAETAALFKAALSVPVTVAGKIRTAAEAEAILASGQADVIAMARTWIAEPDWMRKLESNREAEIRPCMSCNLGCIGFVARRLPGTCVLNPVTGREGTTPPMVTATTPKRIAVIGAGPAGMETARLSAERGHVVTLYEASDRLGGQMYLAAHAPNRGEMQPALQWWARELQRLGVTIILNRAIGLDEKVDADVVIWAVGAEPAITQVWRIRPYLPDGIPGTDGLMHGRDVLRGAATAHGKVLIIDEEGGWPVVSLAETLQADPRVTSVTVTTPEAALGGPELDMTGDSALVVPRTRANGIVTCSGTLVTAVENGMATLDNGERIGPFDTIILSTGTRPRATPEDSLAIGDCLAPRGIYGATNDAERITQTL